MPLYSTPPSFQKLTDRLLVLFSIATLVGGVALTAVFPDALAVVWINVAAMLTIPLIIWIAIPRRFEVYPDRLRLAFSLLPDWNIDFDSIAEARAARWWESYAAFGVRMTTHPGSAVYIQRVRPGLFRNLNAVISPEDRDEFLDAIHGAMEAYSGRSVSPRS